MSEVFLCNCCGKTMHIEYGECEPEKLEENLSVKKTWGYFSRKDMTTYSFRMCEDCFDKMIKSFVIPPSIEEMNGVF